MVRAHAAAQEVDHLNAQRAVKDIVIPHVVLVCARAVAQEVDHLNAVRTVKHLSIGSSGLCMWGRSRSGPPAHAAHSAGSLLHVVDGSVEM
jgi:hypothetical protein